MAGFHETLYGKRFFETQLPDLIRHLKRIADSLEEINRRHKEDSESAKEEIKLIEEMMDKERERLTRKYKA